MKESQIQSILETLIQEDKFYDRINNIDQIQNRYDSWYKEDYIPSFSIDDLYGISTFKIILYKHFEYVQDILKSLANNYFNCEVTNITEESLTFLVNNISDKKHCNLYYEVLMNLLDKLMIPINYRISPSHTLSEYNYLDWFHIREEMLRLRERGLEFPVLMVNHRGEINIADISKEIYSLPLKIDFEHQFVFVTSSNGMSLALVRNWDDIIN